MAYFIALGILSLIGVVGTVWLIRTDGYGRIPTDPSRVAAVADRPAPPRAATFDAAPAVEAARPSVNLSVPTAPITAPLRIVAAD